MEAVSQLPMLDFPIKFADEAIQFSQILKQGIRTYYQEDPESYNAEIQALENLRKSVVNAPINFNGCSLLKRYYCQLHSLCSRFPLEKVENLAFNWSFGYDESGKNSHSGSIVYEMNSIMYNIASMHMAMGEDEMRNSANGMKIACTHFQCAAWAFETLSESKLDDFEVTPTGMNYFKNIALSQAQECILQKSMTDNRKPNIIAKVSMQVVEYLKVSQDYLEIAKKQTKYAVLPKVWEAHIKFKMVYYHAMTLFHLGMQSEEQQKVGEKIAYFEAAMEKLTEASKCTKPLEKFNSVWKSRIRDALTFTNDVIQGKLTAAKKENEFVYHEKIPPIANLPDAKGASLVKCISFNFTDPDVAGPDIFQRLVPIEAHQASSVYSEEKAKLLRQVASQIEDRNMELETFLSSMQLDSFAYQNDETLNALPQELVECCADLNSRDAYKELCEAMALISNAQHEIDMKLGQIHSLLIQEEAQEKEFGIISGVKQPPSQILNELKREVKRCQSAHEAAQDMNKTLHSAITTHKDNIAKLSSPLDSLMASLPSAVVIESEGDVEIRQEIQRLMKKVHDMKAQRADFEDQLRKGLQDDDITRELVVNQGNTEELFKENLRKHSAIVSILEQNMSAQPNILNALSEMNANYAATRRAINQVRSQRSEIIHSILASYQAFMNIVQKVENAKDFYSKMETQLNKAFARAKSVCKVQEEQREEKLSVNVRIFPGGYSPANNKLPSLQDSSVASGPKLKDYLMSGSEPKNFSNPTSSMATYTQEYSSSSVRPSPVGSEIKDNRAMNVAAYVPQWMSAQSQLPQSLPYQPPYSQTSPQHVSTQHPISRQGPIPQPNPYPPARPQSVTYQTPGPHPIYKQIPGTQSLSHQVPIPQSTPYQTPTAQPNVSNHSAIPYQTAGPQSNPQHTSAFQSNPLHTSGNQPIYQQAQGTQIISGNIPRAPLPYQLSNTQVSSHNVTGPQASQARTIQNPVPQPVYNQVNRIPTLNNQIPGQVPTYASPIAATNANQTPGLLSNYRAASPQAIPYQVMGSGQVPQQAPISNIPQTFNSQASPYKVQNYPGAQNTLSSIVYSTQTAATPSSLQYNYGSYSITGASTSGHTMVTSQQAVSNVRFPYPTNVKQSSAYSGTGNPTQNGSYQISGYPGQYQPSSTVQLSGVSSHQVQGGTNFLGYQRPTTPHQQYQHPSPSSQSNIVYHASTHQTIPQDSYTQKYLQHFSGMQTVSSSSSIENSQSPLPITGIAQTSINAGQYANQRYVPSGFGNHPNWSSTNTNTVSFNSMTSSITSPNAQPQINAGSAAGITFPDGIPTSKEIPGQLQNNPAPIPVPSGHKPPVITTTSANGTLSNFDLLAGIDISQTMEPLRPQHPSGIDVVSNIELPDIHHDLTKLNLSAEGNIQQTNETILAKLAKQPKRSTSTLDPLSVEAVLNSLASETERFSKFVFSLHKKSLNGPTNLELKWKELANSMEQKCSSLKISVSRCYPLKNRFADLLPFDETRVVLPSTRDDYINASHVQVKIIENSIPFIMTQAPMPHTFVDFWSMVWDNQVETVVCLNIGTEVKGQICYPTIIGAECNYGNFLITLKQCVESANSSLIRRTFQIMHQETKTTRVVIQCQFLTWPPGEMPESPSQFLQFLEEFHDLQKQQRNKMRPSVVHCVSGTGRSGAFVILSTYIQHLNQTGSLFDIWKLIVDLCQQRRSALQDKAYLLFLYSAALYYAQDVLMKRGILTDKATFEDNPRDKTHVRHPSADLLTSDLSKMKANLGLDERDSGHQESEQILAAYTPGKGISENHPVDIETKVELDARIQIGGATLPPNLAASVDPQQLTIDASKKIPKMTWEQFTNPPTEQEDGTDPFRELDPLWSNRHS